MIRIPRVFYIEQFYKCNNNDSACERKHSMHAKWGNAFYG